MIILMLLMMMFGDYSEKKIRAGFMWNDQHNRGTKEKRNRSPACRERRKSQVNDNVKHQQGFDSIIMHMCTFRVKQIGLPDQKLHYLRDIYTTAVDLRCPSSAISTH